MPYEIIMPKLGLTMKAGTVVGWLKSEGDDVNEKEPVLQIETEKLSYDVESPAKGVLLKIIGVVGEKYPIKTILGYIGHPGETLNDVSIETRSDEYNTVATIDPSENSASCIMHSPLPTASDRVFISPVAKKLAAEKDINYNQIKGTGPNGRIVKADVLKYKAAYAEIAAHADENIPIKNAETENSTDSKTSPLNSAFCIPHSAIPSLSRGTIIPYKGLRRGVGEVMQKAWVSIPMVTHQVSADAGALLDYRAMLNTGITDKNDRVTIGELILKLTAAALAMIPIMNSSLSDDGIVIHKDIHLGMATALDEGLVVPVIRDADRKGLLVICREAKDLAFRARSGTLYPDDFSGATFTVSNLGSFGSVDYFTPIINPPQAAILGVGRAVDAAVPIDGDIRIRPMVGLSLTYDHRIIDGAIAARFIKVLMDLMASPARATLV